MALFTTAIYIASKVLAKQLAYKRKKTHPNFKVRVKTISNCRWHNSMYRKS